MADNKPITRTTDEPVTIEDILEDDENIFTLAVYLQKGRSRITVHEISGNPEFKLNEIPQAMQAIEKVIGMVKQAAGIEE